MTSHHRRWTTPLLLSATLFACGGGGTEPTPTSGTIELTVATTGTDLDADGYRIAIDGLADQALPANGTTTWSGGAGNHTIQITGLAFNCDFTASPATAPITLGQTTHVDVKVSCAPYLRNAIVYVSQAVGQAEVFAIRPDGSRWQRLTTDQAVYTSPAVSPDGQTIAVVSQGGTGGWSGIYLLDRFGKGRTRLAGHSPDDGTPTWSPDGTKLAFAGALPGPYGAYVRVFVVNRDGTGLRQVTPETVDYTVDTGPAWSPDGTRLVYSHQAVLTVINADGTGVSSLGIFGQYPSWSPDGSRIVYEGSANQRQAIFVANQDGTNVRQLTTPAESDVGPQWSPDGTQIVFTRVEAGVTHIYRMAADGTAQTKLSVAAQPEWAPRWTPSF